MRAPLEPTALLDFVRAQGVDDAEAFCRALPRAYFDAADPEDYRQHELFLQRFLRAPGQPCLLRTRGDIEQFVFHEYDATKLRAQLAEATRQLAADELLYRTFVNRDLGFMLTAVYADVLRSARAAEFTPPAFAPHRGRFFDERGRLSSHLFTERADEGHTLVIRCVNVAHRTMLANLWETLESHQLDVELVEVWRLRDVEPRVASFFELRVRVARPVDDEAFASLEADFARYIQQYTVPMSLFDLVGPSMVGPSSSHTAGANRIGQIARGFVLACIARGETVREVEVRLLGSFRDTGVGHKTPSALGGGLWGLATDDETMIAHGEPDFLREHGIDFGGQVARFAGFTRGTAADDARYAHEKNGNIAEIVFTTDRGVHTVTGFSIGGGNVEVRHFDGPLDFPIDGKRDLWLDGTRVVDAPDAAGAWPVIRGIFGESTPVTGYVMPFNTFEELVEHCAAGERALVDVVLEVERGLQASTADAVYAQMGRYWTIMRRSVAQGVKSREPSLLGLSGDGAAKVHDFLGAHPMFDTLWGRAVAYATAVNELNAKSGVIVACPTAGSCGILPGVLAAYEELAAPDGRRLIEALMVAGFLGMLLFNDVSTAGADYGCQAEVGAAAAMAAAALCHLEGGDVSQVVHAFTLAIKNSLGLICDPIAGLVEVPCVKRNGVYSSVAISAALMALSGVTSFVSPDEVILTMREVGERLNVDYKETARAGLAKTRDGKRVERRFEGEVRRFFG